MSQKFSCSTFRESYHPDWYDYDCETIIKGDKPQLIDDAVDHLLNDNVTHSLDEHPFSDNQALRDAIDDTIID